SRLESEFRCDFRGTDSRFVTRAWAAVVDLHFGRIVMPYPTELTKDCLGIVHAGSSVVTGDDLMAACEGATQLIQNTASFQYEFSDFTDVTELRLRPGDLDKIVEMDHVAAKYRPRAIIVVVAPQESFYQFAQTW